ncbi:hypothetical protein HX862_28875 [Pseudomonas sp. D5002]|uniref:hypothetical protein n=1 Tax=Pseudomonas sp. D5002 TaxID=2738818 RepID=UPI0015A148F9|nr:hypothetical protein [Pseudomonas sp. D5002]NWB11956.1 hypothetical protein [Pseudomonas sp. D5002]
MSTRSFNPNAKTFYRPIEAAVRWCNLIDSESKILEAHSHSPEKLAHVFPQWPCLSANTEKIQDAIRNHELPYGYFGVTVPYEETFDFFQLTVRHADLRLWMSLHYPDQKPSFLFEPAHNAHEKMSIGTYLSLRADREALLYELKTLQRAHEKILSDLETVGLGPNELKSLSTSQVRLSERGELTYQQIIGALLNLFLSQSPAGKPLSVFETQAAIVDAVTARYEDVPGLSKRTLDEKFAAANRALKKSK